MQNNDTNEQIKYSKNKSLEPYLNMHEDLINTFFVTKVLSFKDQLYTYGLYSILPGLVFIIAQTYYDSGHNALIALFTVAIGMGIVRGLGLFGNDHQYMNMAVTNEKVQLYRQSFYGHVYLEEAYFFFDMQKIEIKEGYVNATITFVLKTGEMASYICYKGSLGSTKRYLLSKVA